MQYTTRTIDDTTQTIQPFILYHEDGKNIIIMNKRFKRKSCECISISVLIIKVYSINK